MVKARKGLIFSLFALVVALVVTTTSTYAWFAMNSTVTAQNMQVTVVADNTYLVISNTAPAGGIFQGETAVQTNVATSYSGATEVLPSRLKAGSTAEALTWETAAGTSLEDGTAHGDFGDVPEARLGKYVIHHEFWVGLNKDYSAVNAQNLKVTGIAISKANESASDAFKNAVSVCVVVNQTGTENDKIDDYANTTGTLTPSNQVLANEVLADGTAIKVDIYVYINGDCPNVTSANAAAGLGSYSVNVSFGVTAGTV